MWVCGDNSKGTLGVSDGKHRVVPARNMFFDKMRVIDFTCGDGFSVIIAEVYQITPEEDKLYFKTAQKDDIGDLGNHGRTGEKLYS